MLPFEKLKVLDFSQRLPGPYCSSILADMGAEVVMVERAGTPPETRDVFPGLFQLINKNKRSMTLNIKHEEGKAILVRLMEQADVVIEESRPGVAARSGIRVEDARRVNPKVVDRMRAKLRETKEQLRERMHDSIPEQGRWLKQVVRGFFAYHAVPTNSRALGAFRHHVTDLWRRTLRRRSQKDGMTWARITKIPDHWLPKPRILHPWPNQRFAVKHPRWEPNARIGLVRICAGGAR